MKSLAELAAIRARMLEQVNLRKDDNIDTRVVVGMATCGIAAGARPVMLAFIEELKKRGIENVTVAQTGCVGMCRLEPMVEVYVKDQEKVTYVHMSPEKVARIVNDHIVNIPLDLPLVDSKTGSGICLGIKVTKQYLQPQIVKRGSQIHGGGGFSHAALLVYHGNNFTHCLPLSIVCFT